MPRPARFTRTVLPLALAAALAPTAARAVDDAAAIGLDRIFVVARKIAQAQAEVVNAVGQIEREQLDRLQAQDVRDALRYEPAIAVPADANRFGLSGFSIRGLDGNRVAVELDGVPLAEAFKVGDLASAGRDAIDIEAVESIEYLRGPASTLYGSDALAGVIAFRSRDPRSLAADGAHYQLRQSWHGRDDGRRTSALAAWSGERHALLALATRRDAHEIENNAGAAGPAANPADRERRSGLLKYVFSADAFEASLLVDRTEQTTDTDVRSLVRGPGRFSTTTALRGIDASERERALFAAEGDPGLDWLVRWQFRLYRQDSATRQRSLQEIAATPPRTPAQFRDRLFALDQRSHGAELTLNSRFDTAALAHDLVWGLSLRRDRFTQFRDGIQIRRDTGQVSNVILGEVLPVRDFPNSRTDEDALYLQDDVALGDSGFSLVAGLRHERYRLEAEADPLFAEDFAIVPEDIARSTTTSRLGLRWEARDDLSIYALWAEGFRAPPFSDVNIALSLTGLNYEVRPNPDLRDERSRGVEFGLDWRGARGGLRAAVFDNRYRDLIESRANLGVDPASGALVFQSVNRERARIRGVELAFDHALPGAASDWQLRGALAWLRGDDTRRDQPLATVPPPRAVLGMRREGAGWRPGTELVVTAAKARDRIDSTGPALFRAPGYATVDLLLDWQPGEHVRIEAGLFNLFDRRYWEFGQLGGVLQDGLPPPAFQTAPGRNAAVTVSVVW